MTLSSMTGFARTEGLINQNQWVWEIRSVNGKGLDLRFRMPPGLEDLEQTIRKKCSKSLKRGHLQIQLILNSQKNENQINLNEDVLHDVLHCAQKASSITGLAMPQLEHLLAIKGVLEYKALEEDGDEKKNLLCALETSFQECLSAVINARKDEGAQLQSILLAKHDEILKIVHELEKSPFRKLEYVKQQLLSQIDELLQSSNQFDLQRLHQEAALLATKADIEEEIDRLKTHCGQLVKLLESGEPVGRRLEFLCQEFNRESNTICSKASDKDITHMGLELKNLIDQLREQVLNIE